MRVGKGPHSYLLTSGKGVFPCLLLMLSLHTPFLSAQQKTTGKLPAIVETPEGCYQLLVDGKPFVVFGAQLWNSSDWPYILDEEWGQLAQLHCNTLEAPVYWQTIEPAPGRFNFDPVDSLIMGARAAGLKVVVLWFGTFKNGSSQYAPVWVLNHPEKYPRMINKSGHRLQTLSALSRKNLQADIAAFSALMSHIKQIDARYNTVIMVQVENEPGVRGSDRNYSSLANRLFKRPVPSSLTEKLGKHPGSWKGVFNKKAAEAFMSYHVAGYVNKVAKAGQQIYDLPMYTNVWLRKSDFQRPGEYPSGGAVSEMLSVWKAVAPSLAFLAPDIYQQNNVVFSRICNRYSRADNPLFIPEMGSGIDFAKDQFNAIGTFDALGVGVYGVDPYGNKPYVKGSFNGLDSRFFPIAKNYALLKKASAVLANLRGTGKVKSVIETRGLKGQMVRFGNYDILFSFRNTSDTGSPGKGRVLIAQLDTSEFLIIGFDAKFQFRPYSLSPYASAEYLTIEEGYYKGKEWVRKRIWNGDQAYFSTLTPNGNVLKIKLRLDR